MSVREALKHAALSLGVEAEIQWVHSADLEKNKGWEAVKAADGIIVPGGFGSRGIEGKIQAAQYARENKVPYLGLCLGMQVMCVEFARNVLGHEDANSTEFDRSTNYPVIDLMLEQRAITDMGGTMRLGVYPCVLQPGTKAAEAYDGESQVDERHRHRWEFNNAYREELKESRRGAFRAFHRTVCWWKSPNWKTTPTCLAASSIQNSFPPNAPTSAVHGVDQGGKRAGKAEVTTN